jgi:predicted  nucleic acid-binding Zn-ribbon protein
LALLASARSRLPLAEAEIEKLKAELKGVNEALWEIEDRIRDCERAQDFGPEFIELARSVYRTNDRRAAIKRQINELAGSAIIEEKSYSQY